MKTIALTGGGTAGHIMPNFALIPELKKHFDRIVYLGAGGMEEKLCKERGIPFYKTATIRLERKAFWKNLKIPYVLSKGIREAEEILKREGVTAVFSKGGYASLPAAFAARRLQIPLIVHESDVSAGVANRLVSCFADALVTSFPETKGGVCLGNPVRDEVFNGNPKRLKEELKLDDKPVVLVVGGSLGAEALNRAVREGLDALTKKVNVLHVSGKGFDPSVKRAGYYQFPMTDKIPDLYALADVAVTRAGANTLFELAALGKRTIAVPLPKGVSRGDQVENAKSFQKRGLLKILDQAELTPERLLEEISASLKSAKPKPLGRGETNAKIVGLIVKTAEERAEKDGQKKTIRNEEKNPRSVR